MLLIRTGEGVEVCTTTWPLLFVLLTRTGGGVEVETLTEVGQLVTVMRVTGGVEVWTMILLVGTLPVEVSTAGLGTPGTLVVFLYSTLVPGMRGVCVGTAGVVVGHWETAGQVGQSLVTVRTLFVPIGVAATTG